MAGSDKKTVLGGFFETLKGSSYKHQLELERIYTEFYKEYDKINQFSKELDKQKRRLYWSTLINKRCIGLRVDSRRFKFYFYLLKFIK